MQIPVVTLSLVGLQNIHTPHTAAISLFRLPTSSQIIFSSITLHAYTDWSTTLVSKSFKQRM